MKEEWRIIPGYPDYKCSDKGRVMSKAKYKKWTMMTLASVGSHGYYGLTLKGGFRTTVHAMIALSFLGPSNGMHINHRNGVKTDNRIENLEYVSQCDNNQHAVRFGLINNKGENHGMSRLSNIQVTVIREAVKSGHRQSNVSRYFKIPVQTINGIIKGRSYKYLPL